MSNRISQTERLTTLCEELLYQGSRQAERGDVFEWDSGLSEGLAHRPHNVLTSRPYTMGNALILRVAQAYGGQEVRDADPVDPYPTGEWATYRQWQKVGGQVQRGETGTGITTMRFYDVCATHGLTRSRCDECAVFDRSKRIAGGATVFNAAQVEGWTSDAPATEAPDGYEFAEELARRISANSPVKVSYSPLVDRGSFHPDRMEIVLPPAARFESGNALVSTLLHEVGHGTGRLPESMREMGSTFGSPSYAREELIAETTGMMLSLTEGFVPEAGRSSCDISVEDTRANSVSYLANWLNSLSLSGADADAEIPQIAAEAVRAYYVGSALIAPPNRG